MASSLKRKLAGQIEIASDTLGATFDPTLILTLISTLITFFSQNCGKKKSPNDAIKAELRRLWTVPKAGPSDKLRKKLKAAGFRTVKSQNDAYMSALAAAAVQSAETLQAIVDEESEQA